MTSLARPGVFGDKAGHSPDLPSCRKALDATEENQKDRCCDTDSAISRQEPDTTGGSGHEYQDDQQSLLPANLVRHGPEEQPAEGSDEETQGKYGKAAQQGHRRVLGGKE